MAGRGRARGRGISFNVETLGFGRGEALPGSVLQPPPLFPPLEFKPLPLSSGEEYDYLLTLKQEFRAGMRDSPYFIKPAVKKKEIERYSDKYTAAQENGDTWTPDWSRLPAELKATKRKKRKPATAVVKPNLSKAARHSVPDTDIAETLEKLAEKEEDEKDEEDAPAEKKKEGDEEEEEEADDDEYYEDGMEEETDYNLNYFDNGEGGDDDDDLEEGPVY